MKIPFFAAAALIGSSMIAPLAIATPAAAAQRVVHERTVVTTSTHVRPDRHRWHNRRVCRMEWRHHHRVRVCRTVRYR